MRAIREKLKRRNLNRFNINNIIQCQSYIRRFLARHRLIRELDEDRLCAILIIQTTWREYIYFKKVNNASDTIVRFIKTIPYIRKRKLNKIARRLAIIKMRPLLMRLVRRLRHRRILLHDDGLRFPTMQGPGPAGPRQVPGNGHMPTMQQRYNDLTETINEVIERVNQVGANRLNDITLGTARPITIPPPLRLTNFNRQPIG